MRRKFLLMTFLTLLFIAMGTSALLAQDNVVTIDGTVGGYSAANSTNVPIWNNEDYSISQQYYLADEIGKTDGGKITSVAFQADEEAVFYIPRQIMIYMVNTSVGSIAYSSREIKLLDNTSKVFEGEVSFSGNAWNSITLDTPFEYSGGNILLCVVDNTGSSETNSNDYVADNFNCFSDRGGDGCYRSFYAGNHSGTEYDATSSSIAINSIKGSANVPCVQFTFEPEVVDVAKIGTNGYTTFADALAAAATMTGDVTVEIYEKVTLNQSLSGSYSSINFVGKDTDAEIYLDVQGYITATGKNVAFQDLTLSKSEGGFITNAGFMNVAFGVFDVAEVTYTNCTFANGAYAATNNVTFTGCTFYRSHDKYGLWAYGDSNTVVDNCTFADYRGIKMYAEGAAKTVDLTVKDTDFSAVDSKPAIVLTYGESVTLENNIYSSTGTFELDLDGAPNGTAVTSDVAPTCVNDNGACGVLVDGKIYTTVAQAAEVATEGSTVTLLHNSTETVEFVEGVELNKNGFTADNVTVDTPAKNIEVTDAEGNVTYLENTRGFETSNVTLKLLANVGDYNLNLNKLTGVVLDLNGYTFGKQINLNNGAELTIKDSSTEKTGKVIVDKETNDTYAAVIIMRGTLTIEGGTIETTGTTGAIQASLATLNIEGGKIVSQGNGIELGTWAVSNDKYPNTFTMTDGEIVAEGVGIKDSEKCVGTTISIKGGKINSKDACLDVNTGEAAVSGGTFSTDVTAYCAEGFVCEQNADGTYGVGEIPPVKIGEVSYQSLEAAAQAAQAGDEIVLLADVDVAEELKLPAGIILNGNGKQINGSIVAAGNLTFVGHTKVTSFNAGSSKPVITIGKGACLEMNGTGRMVIGHGATFNITGNIDDAKTADVAELTPSLIMAGASFTGAGVTFNVTNAYIKATAYCSSKNKNANGTFDFNIENSIWDQTGSLQFSEPTEGMDPTVNFELSSSVLTTTSHLIFAVSKGEIVFDNSNVNVATSRQIENRSTMTVKNGSVVNGAVATSSNAKNPGTLIVDNATYAVTGEFSGSDLGTGTLVVKNGATFSAGKITKANIQIDATGMTAGDDVNITADLSKLAGTIEVINNDKLEAEIVDGKIVLVVKPVAKIGEVEYATLDAAVAAATSGCTIEILSDVTVDYAWDNRQTGAKFTVPVTINGNGKTIKFTNSVNDQNYFAPFRFQAAAVVNNLTIDLSETTDSRFRAISSNANLTVNGCTFIGKTPVENTRAIIFGEGAGSNVGNLEISIIDCNFVNWKRGITDNENGQDVKTVTVTGNTLTNAAVYVSAYDNVTFTDNTVESAYVNIKSYTADNKLKVTAKENYLTANTETVYNSIDAGGVVDAQDGFVVTPKGGKPIVYVSETTIWGETWSNATESHVFKFYSGETLMGTSTLNPEVWTFSGDQSPTWHISLDPTTDTDEYWIQEWTIAPNINMIPDKVVLCVDGTDVNEGPVQFNGPDNMDKIYAATTDSDGNIIRFYKTLAGALEANTDNNAVVVVRDVTENITDISNVILASGVEGGVSITSTYSEDYVNFNNVKVNNGVTLNIPAVYSSSETSVNTIEGTLNVSDVYYHSSDAKTTIQNGGKVSTGGMTIVRYNNKAESGIYIYGDDDDNTVEFSCQGDAIGAYSGTFYTEKAVVETKGLRLDYKKDSSEESDEYAPINANFVASKVSVEKELRLYKDANLTLEETTVTAGKVQIRQDATPVVNVTNSIVYANSVENLSGATINAVLNADGTVTFERVTLAGEGTAENPYLINNIDDLVWFRDKVNTYTQDGSNQFKGQYVKLNADIDLEGINWTPIGDNTNNDHEAFMGIFDGGNHTISNLYINADGDHLGFFARVGSYGEGINPTVKNIKFNNIDVSTNNTDHWNTGHGDYVGGVIANAGGNSIVSGIEVTGDVYVVGCGYVGGIVGHGYPDIENCKVAADENSYIHGYYWCVGGVIGYAGEGGTPITNCSVSGVNIWTAYGAGAAVAGLYNTGNKIENVSASNVTITSNSDYCMGYIAGNGEESTMTNVTIENVSASAEGKSITPTDAVAEIGDAIYFNLKDAVNAGGNITILRDITLTEGIVIPAEKTVVLDLNGKTISQEKECTAHYEMIKNEGNLTITGNGKISFKDTSAGDPNFGWGSYTIANYGTLVVENGTIEHLGEQAFATHMICAIQQFAGTTTVEDGTISTPAYCSVRLWKGEMIINGGTFDGQFWVQSTDDSAKLTITDGAFSPNGGDGSSVFVGNVTTTGVHHTVEFSVTGGTFETKIGCNDAEKLTGGLITGGNFTAAAVENTNKALLAEGFVFAGEANAEGYYTVVDDPKTEYISTLEGLMAFRDAVNAGNNFSGVTVYLTADIDLAAAATRSESNWTPIGTEDAPFKGTFDGQDHTISNLKINDADLEYAGLFGYATGAKINNVKIHNVDIYAYSHVGAVVGSLYTGSATNCHVSGTINLVSQYAYAGGITGYGYNNIYNCSVIAEETGIVKVEEKSGAAGIVGWHTEGNLGIYNCTVKNLDITAYTNIGGITGFVHYENTIDGCVVDNVNLYKTRENGQASIGLAAGGWSNKSDGNYIINITNNSFDNMSINAQAITSLNQLYGSNYYYYDVEIKLNEEGNTYGNIETNFEIVASNEGDFEKSVAYVKDGETIKVGADFELTKIITVPAGKTIVLDLNGKTITGKDNTEKNFSIIDNRGTLTITDSSSEKSGKMTVEATVDSGWNRYSAVIANNPGGNLTIEAGTIEHLGGTSMAYGIDNLTNGKGTSAVTTINGGTVSSKYIAIRQFLNGVEATNKLTIKGGTINGDNSSIYFQSPSAQANTGELVITSETPIINKRIYCGITEGATEWPVVISVDATALADGVTFVTDEIPAGYELKEENGVWGVRTVEAQIGDVKYATLKEAVEAANEGETVTLIANVELENTITIAAGKEVVLDLNGKVVSGTCNSGESHMIMVQNTADLTIKDSSENADGKLTFAQGTSNTGWVIDLEGDLTLESGTIELTGDSWSIGYAVDVRPNSWGSEYTEATTFTMKGGKLVSSDGAVRVASSSVATHENVSANFVMNGGEIEAAWDGIFVQQSDAAYDILNVEINDGKIASAFSPFRLYSTYVATSVLNNVENPITLNITGGTFDYTGDDLANEKWIVPGVIKFGGNVTADDMLEYTNFEITGGTFDGDVNAYCAEGFGTVANTDGTYSVVQSIFTQTRTLAAGWNWFSSYINLEGTEGLETLETALGTSGVQIKDNKQFTDYYVEENMWYGSLQSINANVKMYMINTAEDVNIAISGEMVDPSTIEITLYPGWNLIAYPFASSNNVGDIINVVEGSSAGDQIKTRNAYADYYAEDEGLWFGNLLSLEPGLGYMYYNSTETVKTLKFKEPVRSEVRANITADNNYWVPDTYKYANNMTITAVLDVEDSNYEVAAFVNGEVRGSARPIYVEPLDTYMFFLTINGDDVEEMSFRCYDIDTDTEYEISDRMNYSNDATVGTLNEPYVLNRATTGIDEVSLSNFNIYPNPTTTNSAISFQTTLDKVEVYNSLGAKIAEYQNVDSIDALETAGIYVIRVTNNGDVKHCRLVVK